MESFQGYEKMPEGLHKLGLDMAATKALDKVEWVVTEKIHGANFSFVMAGDELRYAKRKELLRWTDDFFAFQLVAERMDAAMMRLFERVRRDHASDVITVYGELFGGQYPHPDVPADGRVQAIQTGIYYSPTVEYCVFDIAVEGSSGRKYLDYAQVMDYCAASGVLFAKPLLTGKLNEALFYNTRFDSTIPALLGLPAIVPNLVEGVVIKPLRNLTVQGSKGEVRPIFKIKNKEFAEEQFHESQAWSYRHEGASPSERLLFLVPELRRYLTPQRLHSTVSKIGAATTAARRAEIAAALAEDALESFWEANAGLREDLSAEDLAWLWARVEALAEALLAEVMP